MSANFGVTPDDWLARRVRAAYWSRFWLVLSAIVSWLSFLTGPDIEGFVAGALLTGMAMVECQVHRLFRAGDLSAADIGWLNQCIFAGLFVIYGGYHGFSPTVSPTLQWAFDTAQQLENLDESAQQVSLRDEVQFFYFSVALVGGIAQFGLACFYRSARR